MELQQQLEGRHDYGSEATPWGITLVYDDRSVLWLLLCALAAWAAMRQALQQHGACYVIMHTGVDNINTGVVCAQAAWPVS